MISKYIPPLYALAILLYTLLFSYDLFLSWGNSPLEHYSWISFTIWILPIPIFWLGTESKVSACNPTLLLTALIISTLGILGSLNALQHAGFALALTALLPLSWKLIPWALTAISWLPAFGWLASRNFPDYNLSVRITLAVIGTLWILTVRKRSTE